MPGKSETSFEQGSMQGKPTWSSFFMLIEKLDHDSTVTELKIAKLHEKLSKLKTMKMQNDKKLLESKARIDNLKDKWYWFCSLINFV